MSKNQGSQCKLFSAQNNSIEVNEVIVSQFQDGVNVRLEELLGRQSKIERQMTNIGRSLSSLKVANDESNKVNSMIENTSVLAENVSAKVRRLDEARVI